MQSPPTHYSPDRRISALSEPGVSFIQGAPAAPAPSHSPNGIFKLEQPNSPYNGQPRWVDPPAPYLDSDPAFAPGFGFPNPYDLNHHVTLDPSGGHGFPDLLMQLIHQFHYESTTSPSSGGSPISGGSSANSSPALSKNAQTVLNNCPPHLYYAVYAIVDSDEFKEEKPLTAEQLCTLLDIEELPKATEGKGSRQPLQLFTCRWCQRPDYSFSTERREKIESHIEGHFNIKPYPCDLCPARSRRPQELKRHKETVHKIVFPKAPLGGSRTKKAPLPSTNRRASSSSPPAVHTDRKPLKATTAPYPTPAPAILPSLFRQSPAMVVNPQPATSNKATGGPLYMNFNSLNPNYQVACQNERFAGRLTVDLISAALRALSVFLFNFLFSMLLLTVMPIGHLPLKLLGRICSAVARCNHIRRLLNHSTVNEQVLQPMSSPHSTII